MKNYRPNRNRQWGKQKPSWMWKWTKDAWIVYKEKRKYISRKRIGS